MATLKGRAKRQLFAAKKARVQITPLTVGDVNAIAMTTMRNSSTALLHAAVKKPKGPDPRVFGNLIASVVNHRKGSLYAALVTSIDTKNVFHPQQFAVSCGRLGVVDDLRTKLSAEGYGPLGETIATRAPFFWADLIAQQIATVRKEVSGVVQRLFMRFHESVEPEEMDELIESVLTQQALALASPKVQLLRGADALSLPSGSQQAFLQVFRQLAQTQRMGLLNPDSSLEATFETFYQHLLTNTAALQRLIPRAKFGGKAIPPSKLQRMFRDSQLARRMKAAFVDAYDKQKHDIQVDRLYRSMKRLNVSGEIARVARTQLNQKLSEESVSAIVSGVVGMFFAFAGDTKGQSFPLMASIKG